MFFFGPLAMFIPFILMLLIIRLATTVLFSGTIGRHPSHADPRKALFPEYYQKLGGSDLQARVFQTARKLGGKLTVSDVVIELGVGISEAEELLGSMVDNRHVRVDVSEAGGLVYDFPEVRARLGNDSSLGGSSDAT